MRHHRSYTFFRRIGKLTERDMLCPRFATSSAGFSAGGGGRPGVGMASKGTLVGASFRLSNVAVRREREDADELVGESSDDGERSGGVLGDASSPPRSLEKRAASRGLGAADTLGLGTGVDRKL
jgi:hypothetical protein